MAVYLRQPDGFLRLRMSSLCDKLIGFVYLQDPKTAVWVERYANNRPLFFQDFAAAFSKLLALGT